MIQAQTEISTGKKKRWLSTWKSNANARTVLPARTAIATTRSIQITDDKHINETVYNCFAFHEWRPVIQMWRCLSEIQLPILQISDCYNT